MDHSQRIRLFVQTILEWYAVHKRSLPWRDLKGPSSPRAYRVLVSEIMLQQTQVPRVIIIFKAFLERFPSITKLAQASNADVIMAWRGMGYNSRALRLRDAARMIVEKGQNPASSAAADYAVTRGRKAERQEVYFPTDMQELLSIPGIGPYTAAAIRNFAFGIPTPCMDTNIRRILHRTFIGPENPDGTWKKDDEYLIGIAEEALKVALDQKGIREIKGKNGKSVATTDTFSTSFPFSTYVASDWHSALMDFGSLVQTKRNPKWGSCPLTQKGIMKTTKKSFESSVRSHRKSPDSQLTTHARRLEPGREIAGRHVPNRIIRGRVIEALRDAPKGMTLGELGRHVCIDWDEEEHKQWMQDLLQKLVRDSMLREEQKKFVLA